MIALPYFDLIFEQLRLGNKDFLTAFARHVHFGLWDAPATADGSLEDIGRATERLSRRLCDMAGVQEGMSVLDVGCGFGGTVAGLNERFNRLRLTGLNIDERQLERARSQIRPLQENHIQFVQGDACALPFEDGSFDALLAVECIFHFPDRLQFLKEAHRVLRPGGRLAISDLIWLQAGPSLKLFLTLSQGNIGAFYGEGTYVGRRDYPELARQSGFAIAEQWNVTAGVLPSHAAFQTLYASISPEAALSTDLLGTALTSGELDYYLLTFER